MSNESIEVKNQELIGKMLAEAKTQAQIHDQIAAFLIELKEHNRDASTGELAKVIANLILQTRSMRLQMTFQGQLLTGLQDNILNLVRHLYEMVTALKGMIGDPTAIDQKVEQLEQGQIELKKFYDGVQEIVSARAVALQKNQEGV